MKNIPRISVYYFSILGYIVSYSQKGAIRYTKPVSKYFYDKIALLISCANGCTFATTKHTYQCSHAVKEHPDVGAVFRCTHVQLSASRMYWNILYVQSYAQEGMWYYCTCCIATYYMYNHTHKKACVIIAHAVLQHIANALLSYTNMHTWSHEQQHQDTLHIT